jgi:hypothetical protein
MSLNLNLLLLKVFKAIISVIFFKAIIKLSLVVLGHFKIELPQNVQHIFLDFFFLSYIDWVLIHRKTLKKKF